MANNTPFMKALFRTPKYNVFPQENEVKLSCEPGKEIPVQYWDLLPGDSIRTRLSELTRMAALLAPVYQKFKIDFHAIAIPHRLAIPMTANYNGYFDGFESFHNLSIPDGDRPEMPFMTIKQYVRYLAHFNLNPIGTLFDYLQYPTFADWYRRFLASPSLPGYAALDSSGAVEQSQAGSYKALYYTTFQVEYDNGSTETIVTSEFGSLIGYIYYLFANRLPWGLDSFNEYNSAVRDFTFNLSDNTLRSVLSYLGLKTTEIVDNWINLVYTSRYLFNTRTPAQSLVGKLANNKTPLSLLPVYSYWSSIYDWYINTNLELNAEDKTKWITEVVHLTLVGSTDESHILDPEGDGDRTWLFNNFTSDLVPISAFQPFDCYWANDYFTSAFLAPQSGSAVSIPANGTIADLRNANSLQEFMEKLIYSGKRAIDVVKTIFGVTSSDARLDRTQVIGSTHFNVNFMEITQTSQSDIDSSLGQFAGQGLSVGKDSFIDFQAEEHTLVMVFMRIRPNAVYESQVNKLLFKTDPYDFLIPDFAQVGEQPILTDEIYPQAEQGKVFGYTRRYAEYMFTPSHVHGEFLTSLDYWHVARRFDSEPVLNTEFAKVTEKDDINRMFAVPAAKEHYYMYIHFDTLISRPLGKFVEYSL